MTRHDAPPIVWLDDRIAGQLPQDKDRELAERGGSQTRYISQARVDDLIQAARGPGELIIQIQDVGGMLHGLTNQGRLFAYGQALGIQDQLDGVPEGTVGWHEVAGAELPA